ncbi:MAG TPA: hypothetical protein VK589_08690 [Chryseolinea sp.]|nr:hypothetical protein [Chryseolinea sp.]
MSNQQWSVLLETVSFFFVAIDLYGRERLERTHNNLMTSGEKLSSAINKLQGQKWNADRNKLFLWVLYSIAGVIALIIGVRSGLFTDTFAESITIGNIVASIFLFLVFWVLMSLIGLVGIALLLFLTFCIL